MTLIKRTRFYLDAEARIKDNMNFPLLHTLNTNKDKALFVAFLSRVINLKSKISVKNLREYGCGRFYGYDCMLKKNRLFTLEELVALYYYIIDSKDKNIFPIVIELCTQYEYLNIEELIKNKNDLYEIVDMPKKVNIIQYATANNGKQQVKLINN